MNRVVLCIGGLDSSGGAGVLRDSATVHALGGTARVAVTAVTAQSDHAVTTVHAVPPKVVTDQIDIADPVSAVKIGMLGTVGIVEAVAATLPRAPCVLDPVLMSSSGHMLLDDPGVTALLDRLLSKVDLLTPNVPELAALARRLGVPEGDHGACVERLLQRGCGAVLVKGDMRKAPQASIACIAETSRLWPSQRRGLTPRSEGPGADWPVPSRFISHRVPVLLRRSPQQNTMSMVNWSWRVAWRPSRGRDSAGRVTPNVFLHQKRKGGIREEGTPPMFRTGSGRRRPDHMT